MVNELVELSSVDEIGRSSDGEWLNRVLWNNVNQCVDSLARIVAAVRRMDELGVEVSIEIINQYPYARRVAHGQVALELYQAAHNKTYLLGRASLLPLPDQLKVAKNEPLQVLEMNGDFRQVRPLEMDRWTIDQVFSKGSIRMDHEQVQWLRHKANRAQAVSTKTPMDYKITNKGVIIGNRLFPLIELKAMVSEIERKKSRSKVTV